MTNSRPGWGQAASATKPCLIKFTERIRPWCCIQVACDNSWLPTRFGCFRQGLQLIITLGVVILRNWRHGMPSRQPDRLSVPVKLGVNMLKTIPILYDLYLRHREAR